jgi:hypothetical protein
VRTLTTVKVTSVEGDRTLGELDRAEASDR